MRLVEVVEGCHFRTKATGRTGLVLQHTPDRGTLVRWEDGQPARYLHPEVEVAEVKREEV